ncbi:MAG: hypothetical protein Q7S01_02120 [bacterium]|nr:hypothetical protein [bacterium]
MSKKIIIDLIVLLVVAGFGYFYFNKNQQSKSTSNTPATQVTSQVTTQPSTSATNNAIDCGTDQNCFTRNYKTCTPAKVGGGATVIKGGSISNCEIYLEGPSLTDGTRMLGMNCIVDVRDYEKDTAQGFAKGAVISGYITFFKLANCQGPYLDDLNKMIERTTRGQ